MHMTFWFLEDSRWYTMLGKGKEGQIPVLSHSSYVHLDKLLIIFWLKM